MAIALSPLEHGNTVRTQIDNVLVQYHIFDPGSKVVLAFAPAGATLTANQVSQGAAAWAFDFFHKRGINVIAFNTVDTSSWYRSAAFRHYLGQLGPELRGFSERLGYGACMGAYGAGAFAERLGLDRLLLFTPVLSLSDVIAPFETRWRGAARKEDWSQDGIDASANACQTVLLYDPFCPPDRRHADRFPAGAVRLPVRGMGHAVIENLQFMGQLGSLVEAFLDNRVDPTAFAQAMRGRRTVERYYSYMTRNPTGKMSRRRLMAWRRHYLFWQLRNLPLLVDKLKRKWGKSLRKRRQALGNKMAG